MNAPDPYIEFLQRKVKLSPSMGFDVEACEVNPILDRHQPDAVRWACAGGRRALFEAFGLGKSMQQLEIMRLCRAHACAVLTLAARLGSCCRWA